MTPAGRPHTATHAPTPGRPERLLVERVGFDDLGFLDPNTSAGPLPAWQLIDFPVAVVVGPPWVGKTTVARTLHAWLVRDAAGVRFGDRLTLTRPDATSPWRDPTPAWWAAWAAAPPAPACWIVDGLDEFDDRGQGLRGHLTQLVYDLPAGHRAALRLLAFTRHRDWLPDFARELGVLDAGPAAAGRWLWLGPLDAHAARQFLGTEAFDRSVALIRRYGLQPVAGFPAALTAISRWPDDTTASVPDVWRRLLVGLFDEPSARRPRPDTDAERCFGAACRIAAVATLTGQAQVSDRFLGAGPLLVADLFADDHGRAAARDALRSGPFRPTADGGYRFAQANIRDWLAAFGLAHLRPGPLRSALADAGGRVQGRFADLLPLLARVAERQETRAWVAAAVGGLLPASDQVLPALTEVLACVDRLEQVSSQAARGPWIDGDRFRPLNTPGLGTALATRLQDRARPPAARELLLDIALSTDPAPVVTVAGEIVRDSSAALDVRLRAVVLVDRHGSEVDALALRDLVCGVQAGTVAVPERLRAVILRRLLARGLCPVVEAALLAPPADPDVFDDRHVIFDFIAERMTADDARALLAARELNRAALTQPTGGDRRRTVETVAVQRLLDSPDLTPTDVALLGDIALGEEDARWPSQQARRILGRLSRFAEARRRFFEAGMVIAPPEAVSVWWVALLPEDWPWLRDRVRDAWRARPGMAAHLYFLARRAHEAGDVAPADWDDLVAFVEEVAPGAPAAIEAGWRHHEEQVREEEEAGSEEPFPAELAAEVERALAAPDLEPVQRLHWLAALCWPVVPDPQRPRGTWSDLGEPVQARVLAAVREGLTAGPPSPLPEGNSISWGLLWEAVAFREAVRLDGAPWLTPALVLRWLPVVAQAEPGDLTEVVERCCVVDRAATATALTDAVAREARAVSGRQVRAWAIPATLWEGPELAPRLLPLLADEGLAAETRADLLRLLSCRSPDLAPAVAWEWARRPADEAADRVLRHAGLNCLLALDPERAWPVVEAELEAHGPGVWEQLRSLFPQGAAPAAAPGRWSTPTLAGVLARLLVAHPPGQGMQPGRIYHVTPASQLADARGRLLAILAGRPTPEAATARARLACLGQEVADELAQLRAQYEADATLAVATFDCAAPDAVGVAEAVGLLDRRPVGGRLRSSGGGGPGCRRRPGPALRRPLRGRPANAPPRAGVASVLAPSGRRPVAHTDPGPGDSDRGRPRGRSEPPPALRPADTGSDPRRAGHRPSRRGG